jgi:hypothetical protein
MNRKTKLNLCVSATVIMAVMLFIAPAVLSAETPNATGQKSIILKFNMADNKITLLSSEIIYGKSPNYFVNWTDFRVQELAGEDDILREIGISDPRAFKILDRIEGEPSYVMKDNINFSIIIPFLESAERIAVLDKERKVIFEKKINEELAEFCGKFPEDGACKRPFFTLRNLIYVLIVVLILIVVLVVVFKSIRRKG